MSKVSKTENWTLDTQTECRRPKSRYSSLSISRPMSSRKTIIRKTTCVNLSGTEKVKNLRNMYVAKSSKTIITSNWKSIKSRKSSTNKYSLFKAANPCEKKAIQHTFKEMLFGKDHAQIDFEPKIMFENSQDKLIKAEELDRYYQQKAQRKWNFLSTNILKSDKDQFRWFLNTLNSKLYSNVTNLGKHFYYQEFDSPNKFDFYKNNNKKVKKVLRKSQKVGSMHLTKGLAELRQKVKNKVNHRYTKSSMDKVEADTETLISPLMQISRGIQESKCKKRRGSVLSQKFSTAETPIHKIHIPFSSYIDPNNIENTYKNLRESSDKSIPLTVTKRARIFRSTFNVPQFSRPKSTNLFGVSNKVVGRRGSLTKQPSLRLTTEGSTMPSSLPSSVKNMKREKSIW